MQHIDYWTKEETDFLIKNRKFSHIEVSKMMSSELGTERSADAIRRKRIRLARNKLELKVIEEIKEEEKEDPIEKFVKQLKELQSSFKEKAIYKNIGIMDTDKIARKILVLSDIHFPFAQAEYLTKAIVTHSDADIVVLNGDILDGYTYSSFTKDRDVAAIYEYKCAFDFVNFLRKKFKSVYLVTGNHDARLSKFLKNLGLNDGQSQLIRPDLLARIANGEHLDKHGKLIEKIQFDNVFYQPSESWYVKIGKTLFVHPWGKGSSKPGFTAQKVNDYFSSRYQSNEYDSVVVGHTHKIYKGIINSKLLIEQGCLADLMSYSHSPNLAYIDNGMNGYAVIYQDKDGNTCFNKSGPIFCGEVIPPKKDELC